MGKRHNAICPGEIASSGIVCQSNVLHSEHVESTVRNTPHAEYHRFIAPSVQSDIEAITHVLASLATASVENHVRVRPGAPVLSNSCGSTASRSGRRARAMVRDSERVCIMRLPRLITAFGVCAVVSRLASHAYARRTMLIVDSMCRFRLAVVRYAFRLLRLLCHSRRTQTSQPFSSSGTVGSQTCRNRFPTMIQISIECAGIVVNESRSGVTACACDDLLALHSLIA